MKFPVLARYCRVFVTLAFTSAASLLVPVLWGTQNSSGDGAFMASAQLQFCGRCTCGSPSENAACRARDRGQWENSNKPRGQLTGVCWAFRQKWAIDPATREKKTVTEQHIYSKVRFSETEVASKEYHGRDAGFDAEVAPAWREFVQTNYNSAGSQADGWSWIARCAVLSAPRRNEDDFWATAQNHAEYTRVFLPGYGMAETPEELALERKESAERARREAERQRELDRQKRETEARLAEQRRQAEAAAAERRRQAEAAEAARRAEIARQEAERQRRVDAIARQIGPGKQNAAERLARMNDEVAALRPKPIPKPEPRKPPPDPGRPSVSTDANRCVSDPTVSPNEAFKGALIARVVNGCDEAVDVRICLRRGGAWDCGVNYGVRRGERASYWAGGTDGEVFVDAVVSSGGKRLAQPPTR